MNISIITTLTHAALGITTVSASTEAEACRIASIDFASFLPNTDTLAIVLFSSHPSVCSQYLEFPEGDYRREAAERAQFLHLSSDQVVNLTLEGSFCRQLRLLLEIGHRNSDHGAKLVPVFAFALEHKDEFHLDVPLVDDIQRFLAKRDFVDGFVIINQTTDTCSIMPSIWGRKGVA